MTTTHIAFTIFGSTHSEVIQKAEAEIKRFYGLEKLPDTFGYEIRCGEHLNINGLRVYEAEVTTWR